MLYKFKSAESSDVLMLEPHGRRLLEIIGKTPGPTGIVLPEQMPAAIDALRAAIEKEEQALKAQAAAAATSASASAEAASDEAEGDDSAAAPDAGKGQRSGQPGLRQRAAPFIEMLKRSHQAGVQVVWGV